MIGRITWFTIWFTLRVMSGLLIGFITFYLLYSWFNGKVDLGSSSAVPTSIRVIMLGAPIVWGLVLGIGLHAPGGWKNKRELESLIIFSSALLVDGYTLGLLLDSPFFGYLMIGTLYGVSLCFGFGILFTQLKRYVPKRLKKYS